MNSYEEEIVNHAINANMVSVNVPLLQIDRQMFTRYGHVLSARQKGERRVMWALLNHLEAKGWDATSVDDGYELVRTGSKLEVMELVFNLEEASVRFSPASVLKPPRKGVHGVFIVLGNSPEELVNDYNYHDGDADGFMAVMEEFDADLYA